MPLSRFSSRLLPVLLLLLTGCPERGAGTGTQNPEEGPAIGRRGMAASAHPLATGAGLEILLAGGNAFDAAVAMAACLNVVEPMMSGIGGYGTIVVWDAEEGEARFLNTSGLIPRRVDADVYRPPTPGWRENRRNARAVSTPGNAAAWEDMWRRYGRLDWERLFAPAIRAAEEGFELDERIAGMIEHAFDSFPPHARAVYGREGEPLGPGEILRQTDLARSMRLIAGQGSQIVHGGQIGEAIDRAMRESGGFLRLDDMIENEPEWYDVIGIDYREYRIVTAPPPANAFPALVRLGLMSRYDCRSLGHNTVDFLHRFAEVTKHAFWTRLRYASDPLVAPVPLEMLLSEEYWAEQTAAIDPERARPTGGATWSRPPRPSATPSAAGSCPRERASGSTTPWPTVPSNRPVTRWMLSPAGTSSRATCPCSSCARAGRGSPSARREGTPSARQCPR